MGARNNHGVCPCCQRHCALTFHHLIPKKLHRRVYFKKHFSREQLNQGLYLCRACHNGIHDHYDEMTLARQFPDLESLRRDAALARHFEWVGRQKIQ